MNALIGGLTAATRAALEHRDPAHAFAIGAFGGVMNYGGKYVASRRGALAGWAGLAIASTGTSIVANAGAGLAPIAELYLPIGSVRLRYTPLTNQFRLGVNAWESAVIAHAFAHAGVHPDWRRSAATGTLVFNAPHNLILIDNDTVGGVTMASAMVLGVGAQSPETRTWKHETTHVLQHWFVDETWGRPVEDALRRSIPLLRRLPRWLELGLVTPAVETGSDVLFGRDRGLSNLIQAEAELLEIP
jgi:hypothetical protein